VLTEGARKIYHGRHGARGCRVGQGWPTQYHGYKAVPGLLYSTMKAYGGMEILRHSFLIFLQEVINFTPWIFYPSYPLENRLLWVPISDLDAVGV
jgi:hypothetical protein